MLAAIIPLSRLRPVYGVWLVCGASLVVDGLGVKVHALGFKF